MMLRCRNLKEAAIAVNRRGGRTQDETSARPPARRAKILRLVTLTNATISADRDADHDQDRYLMTLIASVGGLFPVGIFRSAATP